MLRHVNEKNVSDFVNKFIISIGVSYITIPIVLFAFGWLRIVYAIPFSVAIIALAIRLILDLSERVTINLFSRKTIVYWIICVVVVLLWVFYSGIGGFSFQNDDYWFREPVYMDLIKYDWPVKYNINYEPAFIYDYISPEDTSLGLIYYFSYWLIPAFFSKLKVLLLGGGGEYIGEIFLFCYSVIGVLIVLYFLNIYIGRCSLGTLSVFILFSGLDVIPYMICHSELPLTINHMEWWAEYFQFSSNTTQLYWVFNQSIPVWIICTLMLLLYDKPNTILGLISLSFAYSSWSVFGLLPLGIYRVVKAGITRNISFFNVVCPFFMMIFYGTFYSSSSLDNSYVSMIFFDRDWKIVLMRFAIFMLLEVFVYVFVCKGIIEKEAYFWPVIFTLVIAPLFVVVDKNFGMRATIAPLFFLMVYIIQFLEKSDIYIYSHKRLRKIILVIILCIGSMTPVSEIGRSVYKTGMGIEREYLSIGSLGNMDPDSEKNAALAIGRITIRQNSFFYSYFIKY